jgi:hypothetical protein
MSVYRTTEDIINVLFDVATLYIGRIAGCALLTFELTKRKLDEIKRKLDDRALTEQEVAEVNALNNILEHWHVNWQKLIGETLDTLELTEEKMAMIEFIKQFTKRLIGILPITGKHHPVIPPELQYAYMHSQHTKIIDALEYYFPPEDICAYQDDADAYQAGARQDAIPHQLCRLGISLWAKYWNEVDDAAAIVEKMTQNQERKRKIIEDDKAKHPLEDILSNYAQTQKSYADGSKTCDRLTAELFELSARRKEIDKAIKKLLDQKEKISESVEADGRTSRMLRERAMRLYNANI